MVNLTDTATYEDLTSPEGRASFDAFYASLAGRTAGSFKTLHVLATLRSIAPIRSMVSLDFGTAVNFDLPPIPYARREQLCGGALASEGLAELLVLADAKLSLYEPGEILTPLSRADWWEFWVAPFLGMRTMLMGHATKGRVFVVMRGVVR